MKISELSPLQRTYLISVVGEDNLINEDEEVASTFQRIGLKPRSQKWHLTRLKNPPVVQPKSELKKITVRFSDEEHKLLEQLVQAKAAVVRRGAGEVKRVSVRLSEEETRVLERAIALTGRSQKQIFVELLCSARDNPELLEKLKFETKSDLLKALLGTLKLEGIEPVTVEKLQKMSAQ